MNELPSKCPACGVEGAITSVERAESITVKGEAFEVSASFYHCEKCGEDFELMDGPDVLEQAFHKYRVAHNMVQPEELAQWRAALGLTQKQLASLLGWSPATVSRYENGALQEEAHDRELRLAMQPEGLAVLLHAKNDCLPAELYTKLVNQVDVELAGPSALERLVVHRLASENEAFTVSLNNLYELILFFCGSEGQLKTKLNKLLFYADFKFYKDTEKSISGLDYLRYDYGPVPRGYELIYELLRENNLIRIDVMEYGDHLGYNLIAERQANLSIFSEDQLRVLLDVKRRFAGVSATDISSQSHAEAAWMKTSRNSIISYTLAKELSI